MVSRCCLALLTLLAAAVPASSQLVPLGPKVRADTSATDGFCPSLTARPGGGFVVIWANGQRESVYTCNPNGIVHSRSFDQDGLPEAPPVLAARTGNECVFETRTSPSTGPGSVVAWNQWQGKYGDSSIVAKRVGSQGVYKIDHGWLVPLRSGGLASIYPVYTGKAPGLYLERRSDPLAKGRRVKVTDLDEIFVSSADAVETADGTLVIVWMQESAGGGNMAIMARRLDASGRRLGGAFRVSKLGYTHFPLLVAANDAGQFVVAWADTFDDHVWLRIYGADGLPSSPPVPFNDRVRYGMLAQRPAIDEQGNVLALWTDYDGIYPEYKLFARQLDFRGALLGPSIQVTDRLQTPQSCGSVVSQGTGRWVLAWGERKPGGIFLQTFMGN